MSRKVTRRSLIRLAVLCPALPLLGGPHRADGELARHQPKADRQDVQVVLSGEYGYRQRTVRGLRVGATIDAREALFTVANSGNTSPGADMDCAVGALPLNRYPMSIRNCPGVRFIGGRFHGEVPLTSDWEYTYCNSAALVVRDGTTNATIESVRVRRCWDGIRFADRADGFRLKGSWLSEIRDDAVENDYLVGGVIEDCLFDGCFSGISLDPGSNDRDGTRAIVTIERSLIGMRAYLAKGEMTHQAPIKAADVSPRLKITGSVFALASPNMRGFRRLERAWRSLIESRDNALLWLPDEPIPSALPLPPSGFSLLTGAVARKYWDEARRRWLAGHPDVGRFADEAS